MWCDWKDHACDEKSVRLHIFMAHSLLAEIQTGVKIFGSKSNKSADRQTLSSYIGDSNEENRKMQH